MNFLFLLFNFYAYTDEYFEQYWSNFIQKLFDEDINLLAKKEKQRNLQRIENLKRKNQAEADKEDPKVEPKEEEKSVIKFVLLETVGKCWPYSTEIQGTTIVTFLSLKSLIFKYSSVLIVKKNICIMEV